MDVLGHDPEAVCGLGVQITLVRSVWREELSTGKARRQ